MDTLKTEFKDRIEEITDSFDRINKGDRRKILKLIKEHAEEIDSLYKKGDEHWTIETADLIILCYELLILENKEIDEVFKECLPRYDERIKELANNNRS